MSINIVMDLDNTIISSIGSDEDGKTFLPNESKAELEQQLVDHPERKTEIEEKLNLFNKINSFNFHIMREDIDEDIESDSAFLYIVFERPHLQEFLDFLFSNFKVSVWSAATKDYVLFVINNIIYRDHPERKLEWIFFDEHCSTSKKLGLQKEIKSRLFTLSKAVRKELIRTKKEKEVMTKAEREQFKELCTKDLSIFWDIFNFKDFTPHNTIIIDDLQEVHDCQPCNAIQVEAFNFDSKGSENDDYLLRLKDKLTSMKAKYDPKVAESGAGFCLGDYVSHHPLLSTTDFLKDYEERVIEE